MHMFINALIIALLLPSGAGQRAADGPACRAELRGLDLLTRVELPTGVVVEGPWRVVHSGDMRDGESRFIMFAQLDHVIEQDQLTGIRKVVPFPEPVQLAFEGATQSELIYRAAQTWCVTVMRAQQNQAFDHLTAQQKNLTRITVVPARLNAG
jgi:hypothetical protein